MLLAPSFANRLRPRPGLSSGRRAGHSRGSPSWRGFLFWLNVGVGFVVVPPLPPPLVTFFRDVLPVPSAPMQCACSELLLRVGIKVAGRQRYQVIIVYGVASSPESFSIDFSYYLFFCVAVGGGRVFVSSSRLIQNKMEKTCGPIGQKTAVLLRTGSLAPRAPSSGHLQNKEGTITRYFTIPI